MTRVVRIRSHFTGVTLPAFLGYSQEARMAMPMGAIQLAVAIWLLAKGFNEAAPTTGVEDPIAYR